jgi:hypothetical protein
MIHVHDSAMHCLVVMMEFAGTGSMNRIPGLFYALPLIVLLPLHRCGEMQRRQSSWKAPALCGNGGEASAIGSANWIGVPNSIGHVR